jgi:hypothetical protein
MFATARVQHEISCDAEDPGSGVILERRRFRKSSPNYEERLGHHVLSVRRFSATLNELQ